MTLKTRIALNRIITAITCAIVVLGLGNQRSLASEDPSPGETSDIVITAVGDIAFPTESYKSRINRLNTRIFDPTRAILKRGDLVFGNIEAPLTTAPTVEQKTYAFTMPPERLGWLLDAGFNLFSLANNHTADAGEAGIRDTIEHLTKAEKSHGIHWSGTTLDPKTEYTPTIFTVKGTKIGFLAVGNNRSSFVYRMRPSRITQAIRALDKDVDVVILSIHYGKEYRHVPHKSTVAIYRNFVDAGADLILGHHPHVIRGIEQYKQALIVHSLGNYTFASTEPLRKSESRISAWTKRRFTRST